MKYNAGKGRTSLKYAKRLGRTKEPQVSSKIVQVQGQSYLELYHKRHLDWALAPLEAYYPGFEPKPNTTWIGVGYPPHTKGYQKSWISKIRFSFACKKNRWSWSLNTLKQAREKLLKLELDEAGRVQDNLILGLADLPIQVEDDWESDIENQPPPQPFQLDDIVPPLDRGEPLTLDQILEEGIEDLEVDSFSIY